MQTAHLLILYPSQARDPILSLTPALSRAPFIPSSIPLSQSRRLDVVGRPPPTLSLTTNRFVSPSLWSKFQCSEGLSLMWYESTLTISGQLIMLFSFYRIKILTCFLLVQLLFSTIFILLDDHHPLYFPSLLHRYRLHMVPMDQYFQYSNHAITAKVTLKVLLETTNQAYPFH